MPTMDHHKQTEEALNDKAQSLRSKQSCVYLWKGFSGDLSISTYDVFNKVNIRKVSLGSSHSLFLSHQGDVYVAGDNSKGQLGLGSLDVKLNQEPVKVSGLKAPGIDIACGENHCAVVNDQGKAHCWGDSSSGQCGVGSLDLVLLPTPVVQEIQDGFCKEHGLPNTPLTVLFEMISCGAEHSLAVSTGDEVVSTWLKSSLFFPHDVSLKKGYGHIILSLYSDGQVWAWGCGIPLGLGEILHALVPRRVEALKGQLAVGVCCGKKHSMVMVLKGDKSKAAPLSSPNKSMVKAKDIEVDQHYPSRCKSCKKDIFSYTDTSDMCIIETKHSCETEITRSDDSTVAGEESFHLSGADNSMVPETEKLGEAIGGLPGSNSETANGSLNHPAGSMESNGSVSRLGSGQSGVQTIDEADGLATSGVASSSQEAISSPEKALGEEVLASYSSVPDTSMDGSLLCLSAETSLMETGKNELSPSKLSDGSRDLYANEDGVLIDQAKIHFKSDNSIAITTDDDYSVSSTMSLSPEDPPHKKGLSTETSSKPNANPSKEFRDEGNSTQYLTGDKDHVRSEGSQPFTLSQRENSTYAQSVSVESDEIIWKRQSESAEDSFQDVKQHQHHGRSSPSSLSVKSLNLFNQSDAMEYLQRQFEDEAIDKPKKREIEKTAVLEIGPLRTTEIKISEGNAEPLTMFNQVKSMTSRALTNFQSLNVFRTLSADSPTMEMTPTSKAVPNDLSLNTITGTSPSGAEQEGDKSVESLRDDVFSSPESCSMISSVGSLTCEDIADSAHKETPSSEDNITPRVKSGTFMEWRQEISSVGENGANRESNRRSLRTIEMQKRNLSSGSPIPLSQSESKQLPHRQIITTTEVWVWGHNRDGQLGVGDNIDRHEPVWLKNLSGRNVMKLAAGDSHSMALTDNSQIYTWGSNSHGQLGQVKTTDCPARVKFPKGNMIWDISAGSQHSLFLGDTSLGRPDIFYCGKQPKDETNASLKKAAIPTTLAPLKEKGWAIRVSAGGSRCSCKVLNGVTPINEALFELAASERTFYTQLIKTSNLLLRPLRRSSFFSSLDVFPYKSTLQTIIASFGLLTTKIGKGVTDLTATIQHDDCPSLTHFIANRQEFVEAFRNYSRAFSDFLAVNGFDFCTKTGSEFFADIQGNIQDLPDEKEKMNASNSLFLRAMRYPFYRLLEYSRLITKMASSIKNDCGEKIVYQNAVLDWDGLRLNFSAEHKLASGTKAFWDIINPRLADSLRQPSLRVLRESKTHPITLPSVGRFTSQLFVLFNDIFFHSVSNVHVLYPLVTLWVESGNNNSSQQNTFIVTSPEERLEFSCPTSTLKAEWLMALKSAISRVVIDEKSLDSLHSSGERFTPPLIRHAKHTFVKAGIYKDATYNGSWLSGKIHGLGTMTWPDGSAFTGNFKRGLMHGQGVFTQVKGQSTETQQGVWRDGKLNGFASINYANGHVYEGRVKDGLRHGHGMLQTGCHKSNYASVFIGEWVANMRHGYGVEDHILRGEKYMGMWSEDERHGSGVMVTLDGMYFEGNFVHNKLTGFGVMISDDETLYEGDFVGITYLSGKGTLKLPSGDKLEGTFSGSLNEGLKINGTFVKGAHDKEADCRHETSHGPQSKYFGRLSVWADSKWTNVFSHSYTSLGQNPNIPQRNDTEKAWEAVAVMVSEGLKVLKKEKREANVTKHKIQQNILEGLEKIPSHDQETTLDSTQLEAISVYLSKAFESSYHPLGQMMNALVDVFRASYIGVGAHPRLLYHAVLEVKSYVRRIYIIVRLLFAVLPATEGPVDVFPPQSSRKMIGALPDPSFDEDDQDVTIFTAAGLLYPILLPKIYPPLFDLYALFNGRSDDRYWERVSKLNRQGDVGLMAYLGIEQKFWLIQDILDEGKTQTLSTIKDVCYAEAVDQLQQLSTAFSPLDKLKVIEQTFNQITQTVTTSLGDDVVWCMDDLFPIFQFVVVRAKLHHLGAEIHLVEDLMESHLEHGEFGLMLTTLKACYFQIQNEKMPHH